MAAKLAPRPAGAGKTVPPPAPSARKPAPQTVKPAASTLAAPAKTPNAAGSTALTVSSKAGEKDVGLNTLVGEYVEGGKNHGRSYYKRKTEGNGSEEAAVFLYYWDLRDGPNFSGWWFGDKVGGTQVWSRCEKADPAPPTSGWRVPWDGKVNPHLVIDVKKVEAAKMAKEEETEAKEEPTDMGVHTAEIDERVQRATDRVVIAEIEATQALESTHAMMEGEVSEDALKLVEELLQAQQTAMMEAHKVLAADIIDARKSSPKSVTALNSLTPRVRSVQASLAHEIKQAKALFAKKRQEAAEAKLKAKTEEAQAKAEQRDAKALEEALPEAMEIVTSAEESLDAVVAAAGPLAVEFADQQSEAVQIALSETEAAVTKAQEVIKSARSKINEKVSAAKSYAPEAKKVALTEYSTLQEKLNEATKKLGPYGRCRKDHQMKIEGKKVLAEIAQKLGAVEVEVEKVTSLLVGTSPSESEIKTAESSLPAVTSSLSGAMKLIDARVKVASGSLKDDLMQMANRGNESKKKLGDFKSALRNQLEQLQVQVVLRQALEKTQVCEESFGQTTSAEGPFLKGIEAFTVVEALDAIAASKEAAKDVDTKVSSAKNFLKAKLLDVKRFPEETQENCADELHQLQSRVDVVAQKLAVFKRDTAQREIAQLLQEVAEKVSDAEAKVQKTLEVSKPLASENLDEVGVEKLKEATAQTLEAEKAAAIACADAKKVLVAKQKEGPAQESASYGAELNKLQTKLSLAQQELSKQRKVAVQGEKIWKSKIIIQDKEEHIKQVEAEVEKADLLTTPLGDEQLPKEKIVEMDATVTNVERTLKEVVESLTTAQHSAQGALKSQLVKLLARTKKSQEKIDEMKARTREQRERVQCDNILAEGRSKVEKVNIAFEQVAAAEVPYLKGIEVLPIEEANKAVADSEAAGAAVQQAIAEVRSYLAAKTLEMKNLLDVVSKTGLEQIEVLLKKNDACKDKLATFNKETEGRKRIAQTQTAISKVSDAEEAVQRTIIAAAPLATQNIEETSQEAAQEIVEKLGDSEKEAQEKLDDARTFLQERQRDRKAKMDAAELSKLVTRLNTVQVDLAKAKAASSEHEQKFVAKMLLQEVTDMAQVLETELEKVTEAAAPLVVEGGKMFVVASMTKMVADALNEYCAKSGMSQDTLFATIGPGAAQGKVTEMEFVAYLEKLPEMCSRTDLSFSSDQRSAIFDQLDGDKDNMIFAADFMEIFRDRYICMQGVAITDDFDVAKAKTLDQVNADDVVEAISEVKSLDSMGLMRVQVRVLKDGTTGWVTTHGNQGTTYFTPFTAYTSFVKNLDKTIADTQKTAAKTMSFVAAKSADLRECKQGPLADAKADLAKVRPRVNLMRSKLDQLHKKVEESKREHSKREEFERRRQEEKKDREAAKIVVKAISEKVDVAQTTMQQLEEAGSPLTSVNESDLGSVEKPLSARRTAQAASEEVARVIALARESLTVNEPKVTKATKGPWFEAKQEMAKLQHQVDAMEMKAGKVMASVVDACDTLLEAKMGEVSAFLRSSVQEKKKTADELFVELSGKGGEHISEAVFSKHLDKTKELKLSPEQKQLLFQKLGTGGISRRSFMSMLQRYFKCVKEIAITSEFDIKVSTTLRKIEAREFVEVLEGPKSDDSLGVMRIRAKALSDGQAGWITAKGNQGTPFLEECLKPCYYGNAPMPIQDNFVSEGAADIGTLKAGDVFEVVEGPRKEVVGNAIRARGKAVSDGATGWFTVKNKQGVECVKHGKSTFTCTSGIALTNDMNIKDCKVLRKLDKGEVLMVVEGPIDDEAAGVTRIKVKASKDEMEGWVTTKGNAGSVYATESGRTYIVTSKTPLQNRFNSEHAKDVRMLAEDETVELLEGPKEEKADAPLRVYGRSSTEGQLGWITLRKGTMKLWSPRYRCLGAVAITSDLDSSKGEVRSLEKDEVFELLEGPKVEASTGALRMKGVAEKDSATGWVTIAGSDGKNLLDCIVAK